MVVLFRPGSYGYPGKPGVGRAFCCLFLLCLLMPVQSRAWEWRSDDTRKRPEVLGEVMPYAIRDDNQTLVELARRYDLGYNEITLANPEVDPWYPGAETRIILPTSYIVPRGGAGDRMKPLIIINLGELRLYFLNRRQGESLAATFPVGVGRQGFETETGRYWITEKKKNPYWTMPASLREEYAGEPVRVPPGPANPLGDYALRLNRNDYLIHGTNKPLGIGRRISHGCIRMYPEDVERLYRLTPDGCEVLIVYQTVKIGVQEDTVYIEVHPDYLNGGDQQLVARHLLLQGGVLEQVDRAALQKAVEEKKGMPVPLSAGLKNRH